MTVPTPAVRDLHRKLDQLLAVHPDLAVVVNMALTAAVAYRPRLEDLYVIAGIASVLEALSAPGDPVLVAEARRALADAAAALATRGGVLRSGP